MAKFCHTVCKPGILLLHQSTNHKFFYFLPSTGDCCNLVSNHNKDMHVCTFLIEKGERDETCKNLCISKQSICEYLKINFENGLLSTNIRSLKKKNLWNLLSAFHPKFFHGNHYLGRTEQIFKS